MSKKKYLVVGGYIHSKNDGERHYVSCSQLMRLYGVKPSECYTTDVRRGGVQDPLDLIGQVPGVSRQELVQLMLLGPRYDGDYTLPQPKEFDPNELP
jgi:hypothetical protein